MGIHRRRKRGGGGGGGMGGDSPPPPNFSHCLHDCSSFVSTNTEMENVAPLSPNIFLRLWNTHIRREKFLRLFFSDSYIFIEYHKVHMAVV